MAKNDRSAKGSRTGNFVPVHIAARERILPRSSADYVFAAGRGEAAYRLLKIIEGSDKPFSRRKSKNPLSFKLLATEPTKKSA
jgi:hypothetical protein